MRLLQKILSHGLLIGFFVAVFFLYLYRVDLFPQWFGGKAQTVATPSETRTAKPSTGQAAAPPSVATQPLPPPAVAGAAAVPPAAELPPVTEAPPAAEPPSLDRLATFDPSMQPFVDALHRQFSRDRDEWQQEIKIERTGAPLVLLVRGTRLPSSALAVEKHGAGHVVVFDDVTVLNQAQREAAWAEAARRLAHEVKNPLTPIRLATETPPEGADVIAIGNGKDRQNDLTYWDVRKGSEWTWTETESSKPASATWTAGCAL